MLRSAPRLLLFVVFNFVGFVIAEYNVYNNGWMPVSSDKVYNQIKREFGHTSNYEISEQNEDLKVFSDTASSLIHRPSEISEKKDVNIEKQIYERNTLGQEKFQRETSGTDLDAVDNKETIRKAKKIVDYVVNKEVNNIIDSVDKKPKGEEINNETIMQSGSDDAKSRNFTKYNRNTIEVGSTNIYEVTEDPTTDYISDENNLRENLEYHYNPPITQNLTSKFFEILSKYNIKVNDKLQNYELSRQNKDQSPSKRNYRVPVLFPNGYNSPNHLPIDPLFAVFLSNYGVYLPGMYGTSNNYNNLYGYLASNNIHNNKPFGLYKVYSDTDSSN